MRDLILFFLLLLSLVLMLLVQELVPPLASFGGARLQFVPLMFCIGALFFNYPLMLLLAFCTGFLVDVMQFQMVDGRAEIAFGTGILYFLVVGAVCQGLREVYLRGAWWILSIVAFLSTVVLPALQYILISFRRFESSGLQWSDGVVWRILVPAVIAAVVSPIFLLFFKFLGAKEDQDENEEMFS